MNEMSDSERVMWQQKEKIANLEAVYGLRGRLLRQAQNERDEACREKVEWQASAGRMAVKAEWLRTELDETRSEAATLLAWRDNLVTERDAALAAVNTSARLSLKINDDRDRLIRERDEAEAESAAVHVENLRLRTELEAVSHNLDVRTGQAEEVEVEVERLRTELKKARWGWDQSTEAWGRVQEVLPKQPGGESSSLVQDTLNHIANLAAELDEARTALPALPEVDSVVKSATPGLRGWSCGDYWVGADVDLDDFTERLAQQLAILTAINAEVGVGPEWTRCARCCRQWNAPVMYCPSGTCTPVRPNEQRVGARPASEAADTSGDDELDERYVVLPRPTYMGHRITTEYVSPGEVVVAHRVTVEDGIRYAFTYREKNGASLSVDMSSLIPLDVRQHEVEEIARELKEAARGMFEPWGEVSPEDCGQYRDTANQVIQALDKLRAARTSEAHNPWDAACVKNVFGEPTHDDACCYLCRPARASEEVSQ